MAENNYNQLLPLLEQWHRLEPRRIKRHAYLWTIQCDANYCDVFGEPESVQDRAVIQYCVQQAAGDRNWCYALENTLVDTYRAEIYLPLPDYSMTLASAEESDRAVAILSAYIAALNSFNVSAA